MAVQTEQTDSNPKYHFAGWQEGIADSPELGFADMRNVEIGAFPGQVLPGYKPTLIGIDPTVTGPIAYTVDPATDIFTYSGSPVLRNNQAITFTNSGGSFPTPLVANTIYYVISLTSTTFKVSTGVGAGSTYSTGTPLNITTAGTGTNSFVIFNMGYPKNGFQYPPFLISGANGGHVIIQDFNGYIWFKPNPAFYPSAPFYPITGNQVNTQPLGGATTYGMGNGMVPFTSSGNGGTATNYLFACNGNRVEVFDMDTFLLTGTMTWYFTAGTLAFINTTFLIPHACLLATDNRIYFCDGKYLDSFRENINGGTGLPYNFDPTNVLTYTFATKVLTMPSYAKSQCLEQLGDNLLVGDANSNFIYPWDRISSFFGQVLRVPEDNIQKMININNTVYILAGGTNEFTTGLYSGSKGIVYSTQGYAVSIFKKIPEYLTGGQIQWGGMTKVNGHLYIGIMGSCYSSNSGLNEGVYKIFLHTLPVGTLVIDNTPSIDNTFILPSVLIELQADAYFIASGFSATVVGFVDSVLPSNSRYSSYESYVETQIVSVSGVQESRNFEELGIMLATAFTTGEGVRISSRLSLNDTYSILGTFDFATQGAVVNDFVQGNISNANALQLKIAIKSNSGGNTPPVFTPKLKEISIK